MNIIFRMIRDGHKIDVSQLEELKNWSQRENVLAALELDGVDDLIALAEELQDAEELLEYFAIRAETKAFNVPLIKIVVLFHFPPNGQGLHINGVLYTGDDKNHLPLNPTMEEFFFMATHVIMNPGTICRNTQFNREQPKLCFEKTQKLTKANAKKMGKEIKVTEHENVKSLQISALYYHKVEKAVVDFQKNGFKEMTASINSTTSIKLTLVAWNHFDDLGRTGMDRGIAKRKREYNFI